jgi:hypothetical protein
MTNVERHHAQTNVLSQHRRFQGACTLASNPKCSTLLCISGNLIDLQLHILQGTFEAAVGSRVSKCTTQLIVISPAVCPNQLSFRKRTHMEHRTVLHNLSGSQFSLASPRSSWAPACFPVWNSASIYRGLPGISPQQFARSSINSLAINSLAVSIYWQSIYWHSPAAVSIYMVLFLASAGSSSACGNPFQRASDCKVVEIHT